MIVLSLFSDGKNRNDIKEYHCSINNLTNYLEQKHIKYRTNLFSRDGIDLFVMLIDSKTKSPINFYQKTFDIPRKNFKYIPGGKIS